tara:strand:+ start:887 stop:1054 length:168 start_codon:yes stop_codon:yes gene_type:complete
MQKSVNSVLLAVFILLNLFPLGGTILVLSGFSSQEWSMSFELIHAEETSRVVLLT